MRVLHVIPGVAPRYGGPTTMIMSLTRSLAQIPDLEIELATTDADGPGGRLTDVALPFPTHVFRRTISERWKFSLEMARWLKRRISRFDLVHVHAVWSASTSLTGRYARRAEVPYVVSPHGMLSNYCLNRSSFKKSLYWSMFERRTLGLAAAIHATGSNEAESVSRLLPTVPVFTLPLGVDAESQTARTEKEHARTFFPMVGDRKVLLFMGRLHPIKGIVDRLLPAVARMAKDAVLFIAGGQDESSAPRYCDVIRSQIGRLRLEKRVFLVGNLTGAQRLLAFDSADLFVLPSHSENFGLVVTESMARGLPVLITEEVGCKSHILRSGGGIVVLSEIDIIAAEIDRLLGDSDLLEQMGLAAQQYVRDHLTWDVVSAQYAEMYRRFVRSPAR